MRDVTPILDELLEDEDMCDDAALEELLAQLRTRLPQPSAGHWTQALHVEDTP